MYVALLLQRTGDGWGGFQAAGSQRGSPVQTGEERAELFVMVLASFCTFDGEHSFARMLCALKHFCPSGAVTLTSGLKLLPRFPLLFSPFCSTCRPLWELRLFPLEWFDPWLRCQGGCVKGLLRIMSQGRKMPVRAEDAEGLLTLSPLLLKWQSWCWTGHFPLTVLFIYFHQVLRCHKSQVYLYWLVKAALLWERGTAGNGVSLCRRGQIPVSSSLPNRGFSIRLRLSR